MILSFRLLAAAIVCFVAGLAAGQVPPAPVPPPPPAPPVGGLPPDAAAQPADAKAPAPAEPRAEREPVAFAAATIGTLDKVSGVVRRLDLGVGEAVRSAGLSVTLRACLTRPDDDLPDSAAFVEVNETRAEDGTLRRLFTGWIFASALSVSALDHPVYDVWLVACRTS